MFGIFQHLQQVKIHADIEGIRNRFKKDPTVLSAADAGAGSTVSGIRTVKFMARHALKSPKAAAQLAGLANALQAKFILELGTCLGTTAAYLARTGAHVTTLEADPLLAQRAQEAWEALDLTKKINGHVGAFDAVLPMLMAEWQKEEHPGFDLIVIDGNHEGAALQRYVDWLRPWLSKRHLPSILVCDDVRWSKDMWRAWKAVSNDWEVVVDQGDAGWLLQGPRLTPFKRAVRL